MPKLHIILGAIDGSVTFNEFAAMNDLLVKVKEAVKAEHPKFEVVIYQKEEDFERLKNPLFGREAPVYDVQKEILPTK